MENLENILKAYGIEGVKNIEKLKKLDNTKKYVCVVDYQGAMFGMCRILTELEWCFQAYEWCDMDGVSFIDNETNEIIDIYDIETIKDLWTIELVDNELVGITEEDCKDDEKYLKKCELYLKKIED